MAESIFSYFALRKTLEKNEFCSMAKLVDSFYIDGFIFHKIWELNMDNVKMGKCCNCGVADGKNIVMLPRYNPEVKNEYGWGCTICDLPTQGLLTILCNECYDQRPIKYKFAIIATKDRGRLLIPQTEVFRYPPYLHDLRLHVGHTQLEWRDLIQFSDKPLVGSRDCVCSLCGKLIENGHIPNRFHHDQKEIRLHSYCLNFLIQLGARIEW